MFSKKRKKTALCAVILSLVLFLAACSKSTVDVESGKYPSPPNETRRTIKFEDMLYERVDVDATIVKINSLSEKAKEASTFEQLMEYEEEVSAITEDFYTKSAIAQLRSYKDTSDKYYKAEYEFCENMGVSLDIATVDFERVLVEGPYANAYEEHVGTYMFEAIKSSLMLFSPEVEDLKKERSKLLIEYEDSWSSLSTTYEGVVYTIDSIAKVDTYELYFHLSNLIYKENADKMAEIYAKLVNNDKETAAKLGFSSAIDMYYLRYSRDYTPEQAKQYGEFCREYFVPQIALVHGAQIPPSKQTVSSAQIYNRMPGALKKVDPELLQAWQFMIDYNLSDFETRENKQMGSGVFNKKISGYDASYCFGTLRDGFSGATTVIHEFGHFYDSWLHYADDTVFNIDIAEVYSQGLELLMHDVYGEITTGGENEAKRSLQGFHESVIYQMLIHEFEMRAYELDTFDADILAGLYTEVLTEYGFGAAAFADENGINHSWYRIPHIFQQPMYTISYCTSALVALQIWDVYSSDPEKGKDLYMDLIHANQAQSFSNLVESIGMMHPFEEKTVEKIANRIEKEFS